jgi:CheY-like chemotaxis protein
MNTEHRKSILVLEDDVQWQTVVSQALKKTGQPLSIRCVPTAEQAIQLMDEGEKYEFIVADQNLGGASTGLDFYRYCQDTRVSASFVMFSSLDKSSFVDLIGSDIDQPRFVSKLTELKGLQSMFANDMSLIDGRTLSLPLSDAEIGNLRKAENLMLALIVIGAASAGLLQVDLSSASRGFHPNRNFETG